MAPGKFYPTQLETFLQCPLKYRYSKDKEIKEKYRKPTPQLYMGSCVHDALETFYDITRVPVAERTEEKLANLLRRAWAGVGLSPWRRKSRLEERERVFRPFVRLASARREEGLGLGLSLVKTIVEQHGGHVTVKNRDQGGSVFTVIIPRAEDPAV